jgi:hypothetical protein
MTNSVAEVAGRAFELINANPPITEKKLYSKLAVEFIHFNREEIHEFVNSLITLKAVVRVDFKSLDSKGSLFFPAETSFEFTGRAGK